MDEKLLAAVHRGTPAVWESLTTPDFAYVEEGSVLPRSQLLHEITVDDGFKPLEIRSFTVHRAGDTAIVTHIDVLPDDRHSARAGATYLMTETWQRLEGQWKLRLVHIDAVHTDPPAVTLSPDQLDELVGCYRSATNSFLKIRRDGDHLYSERTGAPVVELKAETRDVFYIPGQTRARLIAQRDTAGAVSALMRRDENSDRLWTRSERQSDCAQ